MGFLDHSTNNIIVDAVLTDIGRQMLAANDGRFRITQFALSDEEVDYGIIKKFGRNVGQEKVEKNTPILEALTRSNLAQKFKLSSVSNMFLTKYPTISLTSAASSLNFTRGTTSATTLTFEVTMTENAIIDSDLSDNEFFVEVNNLFFTIINEDADIINTDNTVIYRIGQAQGSGTDKVILQFQVRPKGHSLTLFNTYSTGTGDSAVVKSFLKITGATSGLTSTVELKLNKS